MTVFALIHGAWHGAWSWDRLIPELDKRGQRAVAINLPCEDPEAGSAECAQVITAALDGLDDVIVVGHSLGGLPAAHVATMRPTRHLVYLTPGFPLPGYSLAEAMEEDPYTDDPVLDVSEDIGGGLIRFPAEYGDLFYNACTYTESKDAASKLRLQAAKPITEKCTIVSYPDVPTTVILASLDRVLDLNRMSAITRKRFGLEPVVLRSDHSPFLSMPDRLADRWRWLTRLIVAGPGWRVPWSPGRLTR